MFILLALVLIVAWFSGVTLLHLTSAAVHLFLILAFVSLALHFYRDRRVAGHH
jgi:hypothetical protein